MLLNLMDKSLVSVVFTCTQIGCKNINIKKNKPCIMVLTNVGKEYEIYAVCALKFSRC